MRDIKEIDWNGYDVSIVMTNYNKGEYIEAAIDSVLMQKTRYKYLLIIVDDRSTDGSADTIDLYEQKYPDKILSVFLEKNVGCFQAQLTVYPYMKTKYFTLLDADDYWTDEKVLDKAFNFLETNLDYVGCGFNSGVEKNGLLQEKLFWDTDVEQCVTYGIEELFQKVVYISNTPSMFFRNVIFYNGIPKILQEAVGTLSEASFRGDTDRYIMHLKYGKMKFINENVGVYRVHGKGIWSSCSKMSQILLSARARGDHSDFYGRRYEEQFVDLMRGEKFSVLKIILKDKYWCKKGEEWKDNENFFYMMDRIRMRSQLDISVEEIRHMWDFIQSYNGEDLVIWGCGATAEYILNAYEIDISKVAYFIDNDSKKQKEGFMGKQVKAPCKIEESELLLIATMYDAEVLKEIKEKGLCPEKRIFDIYRYTVL